MRIIMILIWCLPMLPYFARRWLFIVVALCAPYAAAQNTPATTQALLHALDYIAVDYPHVIKNGEIVNADEYAEQQEFAQQSVKLIDQLPARPDKAALVRSAHELKDAIDQHMPGPAVQRQARDLAATVIRAYQVNVAPAAVPSLSVGTAVYQQHCAACHGPTGRRRPPLAARHRPAEARREHRRLSRRRQWPCLRSCGGSVPRGLRAGREESFQRRCRAEDRYRNGHEPIPPGRQAGGAAARCRGAL